MQYRQNQGISQRTRVLIENLLAGGFSLIETAKIIGVSEQWLQDYVNPKSIA